MRLTNKMVIEYLIDCKGYDEMFIEELKHTNKGTPLHTLLEKEEKAEAINYCL